MNSASPEEGPPAIIAGRYQLTKLAGAGGMGTVHQAVDLATGRSVALKLLRHDKSLSWRDQERFSREAALLSSFSHPGIVQHLDHGITPDGTRFLVMEWLEGRTLLQHLERAPLGADEATTLVRQVAESLGDVHRRGVVHRDLKPDNIVFVDGARAQLKLIDFGLARRLDADTLTRTGTVLGSLGYMSPEQAMGQRDIGPAADVFALGCILFECLSGRRAFTGQHTMTVITRVLLDEPPPLGQLSPAVPAPLSALVERMLAKTPELRPKDGTEVASELAALPQASFRRPEATPPGAPRPSAPTHLILALSHELTGIDTEGERREWRARLRTLAAPFNARVEVLETGAALATLPAGGPTEAARAAECALALRAALPELAVVLALRESTWPGADGLDAAADALAAEAMRILFRDSVGAPSPGVRLDEATARRLPRGFAPLHTPSGLYLPAPRCGAPGPFQPAVCSRPPALFTPLRASAAAIARACRALRSP